MSDIGLQTGLRALLAARYRLDTIGHNLANATTPGYSRQGVSVSAASPFLTRGLLIGGGVQADGVQRTVDELLGKRILGQIGIGGGLEARLGLASEIESLFGEPGESGLGGRLDAFHAALSSLSASPSDSILRGAAVQASDALAERFRDLAGNLRRVGVDVRAEAAARVDEVNGIAARIAELNVRIAESETSGVTANDLRDERDRQLSELAGLVDVQTVEERGGALRVLVSGNTLVGRSHANELALADTPAGGLALRIEGADGTVPARGGSLGGLLSLEDELVPQLSGDLDRLARHLILEANRVHSTAIPSGGPHASLTGSNALADQDGDGAVTDELLARAGLPFDVASGTLEVNVTDQADGSVRKTRIAISATRTRVGDFLGSLNAIDGLSATLDGQNRLRITAEPGHAFDFSRRVDPDPDEHGLFGGAAASLGSGAQEPFALADGDTLDLGVDAGAGLQSLSIAFDAADFRSVSQASAEEIAAVVNADAGAQAAGLRAVAHEGRLFLQSVAEGAGVSLTLDGGSALGALGLGGQVGASVSGHDRALAVTIGGSYAGASDAAFTLRPRGDGTIGTTPGLIVDVLDEQGDVVASLEVGAGYEPGQELALADGLTVRFGLGELSASAHDALTIRAAADADTSDALVALGLGGLFTGHDASTIALRADLADDPARLATSLGGAEGDGDAVLALLDLQDRALDGLEGQSLGRFYDGVVSGLGFEVAVATDALSANETLVASLQQRRDSISGVNLDEELVALVEHEQAFSAAAQYITVVNQLGQEILSLI